MYDLTDALNKAVSEGCASGNGVAVDIGDVVGIWVEDAGGTAGPAAQEFFVGLSGPDDVVDSFDLGSWFVGVDGVFGHLAESVGHALVMGAGEQVAAGVIAVDLFGLVPVVEEFGF